MRKTRPDNNIDCYKAQLVVKGYTQIYGRDYTNTFSLSIKMTFNRLLFSIAAIHN